MQKFGIGYRGRFQYLTVTGLQRRDARTRTMELRSSNAAILYLNALPLMVPESRPPGFCQMRHLHVAPFQGYAVFPYLSFLHTVAMADNLC